MNNTTPLYVGFEVKEIRKFLDYNIETIERETLRRTLHTMLDRVCEAADNRYLKYQEHLNKQAEIMAETARRNVNLQNQNEDLNNKLQLIKDILKV